MVPWRRRQVSGLILCAISVLLRLQSRLLSNTGASLLPLTPPILCFYPLCRYVWVVGENRLVCSKCVGV